MAKRGRPEVNNTEILNTVLNDPDKRKRLKAFVQSIVHYQTQSEIAKEGETDSVNVCNEELGLSKGFIKKLVKAYRKDESKQMLDEAENILEVCERCLDDKQESSEEAF